MLQIVFLMSLESSRQGGVHGLGSTTFGLEYWMISSLKIKLNHSWKFRRNWKVPLVLLERSWWAGFNGIYLVRFEFRMWEIWSFEWISAVENSNKFQRTRFWKEKSVEDEFTLGPTTQATLILMSYATSIPWYLDSLTLTKLFVKM